MLDTSYAERRQAIFREERTPRSLRQIANDPSVSAEAKALHGYLADRPVRWEVSVKHLIGTKLFGKKDRIHRMFRELRAAGYIRLDQQRTEQGRFKRGIYLVCTDARWAKRGNAFSGVEPEPVLPSANKESNIDIISETLPTRTPATASPADGSGEAEPRSGAASRLPEAEQPQAAAKGSAGQEAASPSDEKTDGEPVSVRDYERIRAQLIEAGGKALADPTITAGLWRLTEVLLWLQHGYSLADDILPAIRWRARHTSPGRVYSWSYFGPIIAEWRAHRLQGLPAPTVSAAKIAYFEARQRERAEMADGYESGMAWIEQQSALERARMQAEGAASV